MKNSFHWICKGLPGFLMGGALALSLSGEVMEMPTDLEWPEATSGTKPWTRWWWPGSAVDRPGLRGQLEAFKEAGLGGVEITAIYGVKGREDRFIPYLSPEWMEMLEYAAVEANRLGMAVDMPPGSGWKFGGPEVRIEDADARLVLEKTALTAGKELVEGFGKERPQAVMACSDGGRIENLIDRIQSDGTLSWKPPPGAWTLYTLRQEWSGNKVKRAAPGGEGYAINTYSRRAVERYLDQVGLRIGECAHGLLRALFHDSFEYRGDWTEELLDTFEDRRGYDLRLHLPDLAGDGPEDRVARVKHDYRLTVHELFMENFIGPWTRWTHDRGWLTRNQAHGSPGNLLDIYAAADIPETETFGKEGGNPLISKFASSAAHVAGRRLSSSESCTWLDEHFNVTLAAARTAVDKLFVAGINHVIYHGTAYTPEDAAWPGWLFYASSHFEPNNPFWRDLPALNAYITRCQSVLQDGRQDNDILLYWPVHDLWHDAKGLLLKLDIAGRWFMDTPAGRTAERLWKRGYAFDYISDLGLAEARVEGGAIRTADASYRTVLVPSCRFMPVVTLEAMVKLAAAGGIVVFQDTLPEDVPGLAKLEIRRKRLKEILALEWEDLQAGSVRRAPVDRGYILLGDDLERMLSFAGVTREPMVDHDGIAFIRRAHEEGHHYFVANLGGKPLDGWVPLGVPMKSLVLMDPLTGRAGIAKVRTASEGLPEAYLQLGPGESLVLRSFGARNIAGREWPYLHAAGEGIPIIGRWRIEFVAGGPKLPPPFETHDLESWTVRGGEAERFAGTARYTLTFDAPAKEAHAWLLDLGRVCESARVRVNGGGEVTLFSPPFRVPLGRLKEKGNRLEVEVTNLAANRIRDLDRRKVSWKIFHDINFVNIQYRPFDASGWPLRDSGLLGPVRLIPLSP